MMITPKFLRSYKTFFLIGFISLLTACGGGGGGKSKPPAPDSTPNAFTFTAVTGAAVNAEVTSNDITISGINQPAAISITGGEFSVAGGAFTSTASTVTNAQIVKVKVKTAAATNTPASATLNIGGVTSTFTATTAPDVTPDAFTFAPATNVEPGSVNTSAAITVAGVDIAVPISITGGEYSVNDGAFTSVAGTVSNGQTVKVKQTAAATVTTATTTVLAIGSVSGSFAVTTSVDKYAPTAKILFPPPVSKTEGETILVRGTAADALSAVASVKVNGVLATTTDGFANWQATVPLVAGNNALSVVAEDAAGNVTVSGAVQVAIKKAPLAESFPDADNTMGSNRMVAIDKSEGRAKLLVSGRTKNSDDVIFSIDLATGKRTIFFAGLFTYGLVVNPLTNKLIVDGGAERYGTAEISLSDATQFQSHTGTSIDRGPMLLDLINGKERYVKASRDGKVEIADDDFTGFTVLSDALASIPDSANEIKSARGIALDSKRNRYLITDDVQQTIFAVDRTTGVRSVFSSNAVGTGEAFGPVNQNALDDIVIDALNQRAIVPEALSSRIFSIDLVTGNRSVLSSLAISPYNPIGEALGIAIDEPMGYAFITEVNLDAIMAVDLMTGHRVVFSK